MLFKVSLFCNTFDPNNRLLGPSQPAFQLKINKPRTQTVRGVSAVVGGSSVSIGQMTRTFSANRATYRDLGTSGWTFIETEIGAPAPPVTSGAMRVALTITDASNVIEDTLLCCYYLSLSETDQPNQAAAQAYGDQLAAQVVASQGGICTAVVVPV